MREDYFNLLQRSNGYWYYYVYNKYGKRVYRSTGEKRKGKAFEIALERSKTGELLEPAISKHIKFGEYAKDFFNYETCPLVQDKVQRGNHCSVQAVKNSENHTNKILIPDFGKYYLEELTTAQIQAWLVSLPKKYNLAPKTANDYMVDLRKILGQAVLEGYIERNPATDVKPLAKNSEGKGSFSSEQIKLLFSEPWESLPAYAACLLSAKTGMRMGEVRALTLEQIKDGYLEVNAAIAELEGRKTTKSGKSRIVPLEDEMIALLKKVAPMSHGYVFTADGVNPCSDRFITNALYKRMEACKIARSDEQGRPLTFHSFRYFMNTRLIVGNISSEKIRATIGHESEKMTEHYTRLSGKDFEDIRSIQKEIC